LLLEGLVDGRNRIESAAQLASEMASTIAAYRSSPTRLVMREGPGTPVLAEWLVRETR
jgi:hypothetical protein